MNDLKMNRDMRGMRYACD